MPPLVLDGTNGVSGVDGTASNPAIEGTDSNTGVFFPAADTVAIGTGGTEALRVNSSQQVGIGTQSPAQTLHVKTSTSSVPITLGVLSNATGLPALSFNGAYASTTMAGIYGNGATASNLYYTVPASQSHFFAIADSTKMTLDSAGNLGLGVTPSAWASGTFPSVLQLKYGAFAGTGDGNFRIFTNTVYDGSYKYIANGFASRFELSSGGFTAFTAASGTAGNAITFTQAMTLDASGNLGVGTTSPTNTAGYQTIEVNGSSGGIVRASFSTTVKGYYFANSAGVTLGSESNDALMFRTNATERARITSDGYFKASNTGTYLGSTASYHEFRSDANNTETLIVTNNGTSGQQYGMNIRTTNDQNDATRYFLTCQGATTTRAQFRSNGGLANYSANNVNLASDQRLKKDVSPLATTWDKVKQIEVVNFRYKDCNEGDPLLYGVIAQQVQPIVPELVVVTQQAKEATEDTEATPEYYGIREQPMYWLAIKALQEAMTRIEALETEIAALKGNA